MRKIFALLLALVMLLLLIACGKTEVPKENDNVNTSVNDKKPEDTETPKDNSIPFSCGRLPIITDEIAAVWEMNVIDFENEYGDEILKFVNVYQAKGEYYPHLLPWFVDTLENNNPKTEEETYMVECVNRYNEAFFEEKQLLTITLVSITSYGYTVHAEKITPVIDESGNTTYHIQLRLKYNTFGADAMGVGASTVSIELDKSLHITPENLTIELIK